MNNQSLVTSTTIFLTREYIEELYKDIQAKPKANGAYVTIKQEYEEIE